MLTGGKKTLIFTFISKYKQKGKNKEGAIVKTLMQSDLMLLGNNGLHIVNQIGKESSELIHSVIYLLTYVL